jgi:hypothetical protein
MKANDPETLYTINEIEQDKAILLSVDKWLSISLPFVADQKLMDVATKRIDMLVKVQMAIDDKPVSAERVTSPIFSLNLKHFINEPELPENHRKIVRGRYKALSEGYWIFIKPYALEKGTHRIHTFASCKSSMYTLDVDHTIKIF